MAKLREGTLVYPTFLSLGILGFLFSLVGVTLPALRTAFGLDVEEAGLVTAIVQLGYAAFCFIGGILSDLYGKKRILAIGCLVFSFSGLLIGRPASFAGNLVFFAGLGVGAGLIFISSNALVVALFPEKRGAYLNLHHLVFAIASFTSPLIGSRLLLAGAGWFAVYRWLALAALLIGLCFLFTVFFGRHIFETSGSKGYLTWPDARRKYVDIFKSGTFLLLVFSGLLAMGMQFGIIYLLVMFLNQARNVPLATASTVLSVYFIFLALGRFICARLSNRISLVKILSLLQVTFIVFFALGWLSGGFVSLAFFGLTGLACSGLMPNMLAVASRILPEDVRGAALGVFSLFGGIGGMAATYATTQVAGRVGLDYGFLTVLVVAFMAITLFTLFSRRVAKNV